MITFTTAPAATYMCLIFTDRQIDFWISAEPGRDFIFLQANFSSLHQTTWNIFPSLPVSAEVYTSISFSSKFLVGSFNQYRSQGSQCPVLPNYLTTTFRLQQWLTETFEQEFAFVRHIDILFSSNPKLLPDSSRYMHKQEFIEAKRNFSHYWPSENIFPQTIFNMHGKIPVDDEFLKRIATAMHTQQWRVVKWAGSLQKPPSSAHYFVISTLLLQKKTHRSFKMITLVHTGKKKRISI